MWQRHRCVRSVAVRVCPATTLQCVLGDPLHTEAVPQQQNPLTRVSERSIAAPQVSPSLTRTLLHAGTTAYHTPLSVRLGVLQHASRTPNIHTSVDDVEPAALLPQDQSPGASLISIGVKINSFGSISCHRV